MNQKVRNAREKRAEDLVGNENGDEMTMTLKNNFSVKIMFNVMNI